MQRTSNVYNVSQAIHSVWNYKIQNPNIFIRKIEKNQPDCFSAEVFDWKFDVWMRRKKKTENFYLLLPVAIGFYRLAEAMHRSRDETIFVYIV